VATTANGNPEDTAFRVRSSFERTFCDGEVVYGPGEPAEALFVIQAGQVELRRGDDGERVVARYGPGDFFGEMAVLLGRPRAHQAVAVAETRLLQLDAATFEAMCVDRPEIAIRVIQRIAARAIDLEQRLSALGVDDLLRPVVRVLVRGATPGETPARVETTLRKLAGEAGLNMLEAHRGLGQLLDQKLVKLSDDVVTIPDLELLSAALDPGE
jgi:CRP-like cAMP-binding protein